MTASRARARRTGLLAALLLAGCQPLPHPFADDRPPAALLRVRDVAGVSIAPIVGKPSAAAERLAAALAKELQKRDIPASDRTASLDSYQLYGRLAESPAADGGATVTALWRLYDAKGRTVGERSAEAEVPADWASDDDQPIAKLAGLSADRLAPLLVDEPPIEAKAKAEATETANIRVAIGAISGAPGDGAKSLATAIAGVLQRQNLAIVADGGKADFYVDADIAVSAGPPGKQHIKIVWHVRRATGGEIGTVAQGNDVPRGLLDGPWGDTAYLIALAAGDGLMQLVERGGPPPKS